MLSNRGAQTARGNIQTTSSNNNLNVTKVQTQRASHMGDRHGNYGGARSSMTGLKLGNRKKAITQMDNNYILIHATTKLSMDEIEELHKQFQRYDVKRIDSIRYDEVDDVFRDMGLEINEHHKQKIIFEMDKKDKRYADFKMCCDLFVVIKKVIEKEIDEANNADFVNAFTALGGNQDRSGYILRSHIINIVKNEFELTFDIDKFLGKKGVDKDEMDYNDFCALFDHGDHQTQDILSLFSHKTGGGAQGFNSKRNSFSVSYKNYDRWCEFDFNSETGSGGKRKKTKFFTKFKSGNPSKGVTIAELDTTLNNTKQ